MGKGPSLQAVTVRLDGCLALELTSFQNFSCGISMRARGVTALEPCVNVLSSLLAVGFYLPHCCLV